MLEPLHFKDLLDENLDEIVSHLDAASRGMLALTTKRLYARFYRAIDMRGLRWVHTAMQANMTHLVRAVSYAPRMTEHVFRAQLMYFCDERHSSFSLDALMGFCVAYHRRHEHLKSELFLRRLASAIAAVNIMSPDHYVVLATMLAHRMSLSVATLFIKLLCEVRAGFFLAALLYNGPFIASIREKRCLDIEALVRYHGRRSYLKDGQAQHLPVNFRRFFSDVLPILRAETVDPSSVVYHYGRPLTMTGDFVAPYVSFYCGLDAKKTSELVSECFYDPSPTIDQYAFFEFLISEQAVDLFTLIIRSDVIGPHYLFWLLFNGFARRTTLGLSASQRSALTNIMEITVRTYPAIWAAHIQVVAGEHDASLIEYAGFMRMVLAIDPSFWRASPITKEDWHVFFDTITAFHDTCFAFVERLLNDFAFATFVREHAHNIDLEAQFTGHRHYSVPRDPFGLVLQELLFSQAYTVDAFVNQIVFSLGDSFVNLARPLVRNALRHARQPMPDADRRRWESVLSFPVHHRRFHPPDVLRARIAQLGVRIGTHKRVYLPAPSE